MEDRVLVTVLASGFDQQEQLETERRNSLHLGHASEAGSMAVYTSGLPPMSQPLPPNVVSGRVYGEPNGSDQGPTPTRLLPQAPTPSGELSGTSDDLHIPAIMRNRPGLLPMD
jgi:cell division protein FtsZ